MAIAKALTVNGERVTVNVDDPDIPLLRRLHSARRRQGDGDAFVRDAARIAQLPFDDQRGTRHANGSSR